MKKQIICWILIFCTVFTLLPLAAAADKNTVAFQDVNPNAYYNEAVLWAVENGITNGTSENTFSPNDNCTRAQVVTFLWRAEGCPAPECEDNPFTDVSKEGRTAPYYNAVLWAAEQSITLGYDETHFKPNATVSRAQFVTLLWRAAGKPESHNSMAFTDVPSGEYYTEAVSWAVENSITRGYTDKKFAPHSSCTRAQVVTFLYRWKVGELATVPCVCIDAGHQAKQDSGVEPLGPGSSTMKMKCSSGAVGTWTGIEESELNLAVSLKLQKILETRGYRVVMTRTTQDVNLSSIDRAKIAENGGADIFVRIHANAFNDSSVNGALTLCMTESNPYNANLYDRSYALSNIILDYLVSSTGCKRRNIIMSDSMTGINWAAMPVTIVEMGFMTNQREDKLMATDAYREKLAIGIAEGIDAYFAKYPA